MKQITLNLGGKDRLCHFGFGFIGNLLDAHKISYTDFDVERNANPFKWMPIMIFHSMEYALLREDKEVDFTLKNVIEWIDETDLETLIKFRQSFDLSLTKDVPTQPEVKKKVTKK